MKASLILLYLRKNLEAIIWLGALISLFFLDPAESHFSLCAFSHLGFDYCPGCGLGRSIAHFFNGELVESFTCHPLGIPAFFILSFRILAVIRNSVHSIHNITNN